MRQAIVDTEGPDGLVSFGSSMQEARVRMQNNFGRQAVPAHSSHSMELGTTSHSQRPVEAQMMELQTVA